MSQIAEAFVRIRPNMAGFEAEAQTGVTSAFSKLGKIAGVAFGAAIVVDFGKDIVGHAADVQKQIEAVRAEFGKAGEDIIKFGEDGGSALGISAHLADQTAARFGILFKNLGIGPELAAKMTVNFEKLGGSISQIRNIDPASVFQSLPLAVAGNLRSLKQLGISVDQNSLKVAAFKLGLTQTISQGLTPAQRAIAIYALAMAHLGEFQAQAGKHSEDLANRTRKLRAEWDNARDELGAKLIPAISDLAQFLTDTLPGALKATGSAFSVVGEAIDAIVGPIGGLKDAVVTLLLAFATAKLYSFVAAFNPISIGIRTLAAEFEVTSAEVVSAFGIMGAAAEGFSLAVRAAISATLVGALFVGIALLAEYVITHWSKVKQWFVDFARFMPALFQGIWLAVQGITEVYISAMLVTVELLAKGLAAALGWIPGIGPKIKAGLSVITDGIDQLRHDGVKKIRQAGSEIAAGFTDSFRGGLEEGFQKANAAIDEWSKGTAASRKKALADLSKQGFTTDLLTGDSITKTGEVISKQKQQLDDLTSVYAKMVQGQDAGVAKIKEKLATLGQSLKDAVSQQTQDLKDAVESAKSSLSSLAQAVTAQIGQVLDKPIQDAQNKISALQNKQSLENLRASVLLSGGKQLSKDPKQALAELQALAQQAGNVNRAAIQSFITQYRAAALTVQQDQVNKVKENATQRVTDLTDAFNRGQITLAQYKKRVLAILSADHVSYKNAGALLGTAFANGFRQSVGDLFKQAGAISAAPAFKGLTGSNANIVTPLEAIRADQKQVATIQRQIRDQHGALQTRIEKNTAATNALLQKIHSVQLGATSKSLTKNPGGSQKRTAALNGTTH